MNLQQLKQKNPAELINEAEKLKEDAKNILTEHEKNNIIKVIYKYLNNKWY